MAGTPLSSYNHTCVKAPDLSWVLQGGPSSLFRYSGVSCTNIVANIT